MGASSSTFPTTGDRSPSTSSTKRSKVLLTEEQILRETRDIALAVKSVDWTGPLLVATILEGGRPFSTLLTKPFPQTMFTSDELIIKSYANQKLSEPNVVQWLQEPVVGREVLLVDDICDTGETVICAANRLLEEGARSVNLTTLLVRDGTSQVIWDSRLFQHIWFGKSVRAGQFAFGFGMDYNGENRQLREIRYVAS